MKALSMIPENAFAIATGFKTVELRSWTTDYRGDLLICASADLPEEEERYFIKGHALAVARLVDIVPFTAELAHDADVEDPDEYKDAHAWLLADIRPIVPTPVEDQDFVFDVEISSEFIEHKNDDLFDHWVAEGYIEVYEGNDDDDDDDDHDHDHHGHHHH